MPRLALFLLSLAMRAHAATVCRVCLRFAHAMERDRLERDIDSRLCDLRAAARAVDDGDILGAAYRRTVGQA